MYTTILIILPAVFPGMRDIGTVQVTHGTDAKREQQVWEPFMGKGSSLLSRCLPYRVLVRRMGVRVDSQCHKSCLSWPSLHSTDYRVTEDVTMYEISDSET